MRHKKSSTLINACALGMLNGMLIGVLAEQARVSYLAHLMSEASRKFDQRHPQWVADFFYPDRSLLVPFVCAVAFAVTSYVVHQYFISRPHALLSLWLVLGAAAVWAGYFMSTSEPHIVSYLSIWAFAAVSYFAYRLWKNHPRSSSLLWLVIGVSAVIVVASGVQVVGLLFYWPEWRSPSLWLVCLAFVMILNSLYGVIIQHTFSRHEHKELKHTYK